MLRKLVAAALFVLVVILAWEVRHRPAPISHSSKATVPVAQFSLTDLDGKPIDSNQLKGKVVLVDFWATWCVPCASEIPQFVEWQNAYGAQGLQIVGLSMDDTASPVRAYVQQKKISYPVAMADEKTIAAFGGVLGLPANILLDRQGKVIVKHVGVADIHVLQREVEDALKASGS